MTETGSSDWIYFIAVFGGFVVLGIVIAVAMLRNRKAPETVPRPTVEPVRQDQRPLHARGDKPVP
ncbi:phage holin family protein [Oleisolibacter albus]|uniref:phage holin family protein n=1 Tax=Oleisolibacter albus TaxID=2171757 RepID=UPI000DF28117|nr:phage holin family protein [Oleisolibacter albus]